MRRLPRLVFGLVFGLVLAPMVPRVAVAQVAPAAGWALERHDPPPAGDDTLAVDHPRYARDWDVSVGIGFGHAFTPLQLRRQFADTHVERRAVLSGMSTATLDASVSFLGRVSADLSLPISLAQTGEEALLGVLVVAPAEHPVLGDLRLGGRVRLVGRAGHDPFSLHLGAWLWFPTGSPRGNTSDGAFRFEPRFIAAGTAAMVRWSFIAGFRFRRHVEALNLAVGHEFHLRAGATVALYRDVVRMGPELALVTPLVTLPDGTASAAFAAGQWGLEALLGTHVALGHGLVVSVGGGFGIERGGGTPAGRVLVSLRWRGGVFAAQPPAE